jgi:glycosyltransferase involved in cell wall biosynthesis
MRHLKSLYFQSLKLFKQSTIGVFFQEILLKPMKLVLDQPTQPQPLLLPQEYFERSLTTQELPLISIVTPSYNQAQYIERTINSVLNQEYPKLEYIIQDGASTDDTSKLLAKYNKKIAHIFSQLDTGQANAINLGFTRATGEIMAWLNSDDLLLPGTLAYVANFFSEHPEVDVVYGHRLLINAEDQIIGKWVLPPHNDDVLTWADYIPQETMFWRRSLWEKVGACLDESYKFALDWELIIRFREQSATFARLPRFLGAFRVHPEQKTTSWNSIGQKEMDQLRFRCHQRYITQAEVNQKTSSYRKQAWKYYWLDRLNLLGH